MRHPIVWAVGLVSALVYTGAIVANATDSPGSDRTPPQPRDEAAFIVSADDALNGYVGHPLSRFVPFRVLRVEGEMACAWLDRQPPPRGPDQAAFERVLDYQRAVPPSAGWPFGNRPGRLRAGIVYAAWDELCDDVQQRQTWQSRADEGD